MKHSFLKKLTALLLGAIMVFSMIPAIAISTKAANPTEFELVTDASTLKEDDQIIIVGANGTKYYALGTTQNTNNRAAVAITVTNNKTTIVSTVQVLTLKTGTVSGTFGFYTGSNYLYAASSSGNQLKQKSALDANGSWKIEIDSNGKATIKAQGNYSRNWMLFNKTNTIFAAYSNTSSQVEHSTYIYKAVTACAHANTEAIGTPSDATCTEPGITAGVKCSDCGEVLTAREPIEATGHTDENGDSKCDTCGENLCNEHVWVDGEVIAEGDCTTDRVVAQVCEKCGEPGEDKVTTAPGHTPVVDKAKDATCTETGLTEGSHCDVCDEVITKQETVPMLDHNYVEGICTACGAEKPVFPTFEKVTSTLDDFTGTYLIVYEAGKLAFNGSLSTLDAGKNGVGVIINDKSITGDYGSYTFTIEKTTDGKYVIKSASGMYIGQTSYANGLKTTSKPDYKHEISIDTNGNAVITALLASGSDYPTLRYNASTGDTNQRFRYYKSGQQAIALYKLVEAVEAPKFDSFGVTLDKGVTIRVNLTFDPMWIAQNPDARIIFSDSKGTQLVPQAGTNPYTITLTPGEIGRDIKVSVSGTSINETVSFAAYKAKVDAITDPSKLGYANAEQLGALKTLLAAIETYGKVAAKEETAVADFKGVVTPDWKDDANILGGNLTLGSTLDEYADIGITVCATENLSYTISFAGNLVRGNDLASLVDEYNKLTIENLRPANFDDEIVLTVTNANDQTTTVTVTFNGYLKGLYGTEGYSDIAAATYNYGLAVEAYLTAIQ